MATINGVAINFAGAVKGTTITISGVGTMKLQSADHSKAAESEIIYDEEGNRVARTWYGHYETASFTYVVSGSSLADALTQSTIPDIGAIGTVANTTTYAAIAGTNWEVVGVSTAGSNTTALRVTLQLERCDDITSAASAGA